MQGLPSLPIFSLQLIVPILENKHFDVTGVTLRNVEAGFRQFQIPARIPTYPTVGQDAYRA
jgi:hypothetical protein